MHSSLWSRIFKHTMGPLRPRRTKPIRSMIHIFHIFRKLADIRFGHPIPTVDKRQDSRMIDGLRKISWSFLPLSTNSALGSVLSSSHASTRRPRITGANNPEMCSNLCGLDCDCHGQVNVSNTLRLAALGGSANQGKTQSTEHRRNTTRGRVRSLRYLGSQPSHR